MTQQPIENSQARRPRSAVRPRPDMLEDVTPLVVTPAPQSRDDRPVNQDMLVAKRGGVEVTAAWFVLAVSFVASGAALFPNQWGTLIDGTLSVHWWRFFIGIGIQGLLTYVQWVYPDRPLWVYGSRAIDATLTAIGLQFAVIGWLPGMFPDTLSPMMAQAATWAIWWIVCLLPAWFPEARLMKRRAL